MSTNSSGGFLARGPRQPYEELVNSIEGIVWEVDARTFLFTFVSQQAERLLGYPLARWFEPGFWANHLHPEDRDWALEFCLRATREKRSHDFEYRMVAADGRTVWLQDIVRVVVEGDEATKLRGIMVDVTDRKRAEQKQRESEELYRLFAENTNDVLTLLDLEGRRVYASPSYSRLLGRAPTAEVGLAFEYIHPEDREMVRRVWEAVRAGEHKAVTFRYQGADGSWQWIEAWGRLVQYLGKPHILGVNRVITERKRIEEERQANLWFLEGMDQVNRAIHGTNDITQMMSAVLDAVLAIFACDRAWLVYPCDPEAAAWRAPMERTRPEYPGALALGLEVPVDPEVARVMQTVRAASGPVRFGPGSEHPLPTDVAKQFSIQSMIVMAAYPKVDRPYMFGVHQCSYRRVWTVQEQRLFQEIGQRLADALTSLLAYRALRENERKLEEAQRVAHVGYWERDLETDRLTWSDETYRIFGLPPQKRILDLAQLQALVHPEDWPVAIEAFTAALGTGPRYNVEYRVVRPNGEVRFVHSQGDVTRDESGRRRCMFGTLQDITERKRAEEALRAGEVRFRTIVDHATDAFFLHDAHGTVIDVNRQACESLGYTREELIGMHPSDFDADAAPPILTQIGERLEAGEIFAFDTRHRRKDGTVFPVEVRVRPFWEGGTRFGVSLARDITERKRGEEALRRSEAYLAEAQRLSRTGSWAWDVATREFVHWSQEHYRLHGRDPQRGMPSWEEARQFIHPDDRARCLEGIETAIRERTDCVLDYRAVLPDGTVKFIHSIAHPVFNATGELVEFVGTEMDVTDRKRAEAALRESEQRYREVFNCSSECIFLIDVTPDGRFQFAEFNPTEERTVGYATADVAGRFIEDVIPTHLAAAVIPNYRHCVEAGTLISYDEELNLTIGRKSFHTNLVPVRDETGRVYRIIGVARDVTEQKQAEAALRASLREKEVLLKEVHHRVKNNLQLISSLLALQAGQLKDRAAVDALTESQNRVRSMALVHENLYRSGDLASVRLARHVEGLCAHLVRSYNVDPGRVALDLRVAEVTLDLDRSIRVGLLVNELVSNVLKHAFPAGRTGRVLVQLDMPHAEWYTLVVSDNGVGLASHVAAGHSDSLGLQLVTDLTEQLGGTLTLDRSEGTTISIRFPAGCPEESLS